MPLWPEPGREGSMDARARIETYHVECVVLCDVDFVPARAGGVSGIHNLVVAGRCRRARPASWHNILVGQSQGAVEFLTLHPKPVKYRPTPHHKTSPSACCAKSHSAPKSERRWNHDLGKVSFSQGRNTPHLAGHKQKRGTAMAASIHTGHSRTGHAPCCAVFLGNFIEAICAI